jgi:xanthine dehydrogenase YagS FAD-binding subunit
VVWVAGPDGERAITIEDFHRVPGDTPHIDTSKRPDEIITAVDLPARGFAERYAYLKVRDRASYAFALVSVAAALRMTAGTIEEGRVALGGVAHKPWRDRAAESALAGQPASRQTFERVADELVRGARDCGLNAFKIPLARRAIVRSLQQAAAANGGGRP